MASSSQQRRPNNPIKVLIVGAGITGLTTALALTNDPGHNYQITVLERDPDLLSPTKDNTGGGILLPPNATRILTRLGLPPASIPSTAPTRASQRRYADDAEICALPVNPGGGQGDEPLLLAHRADLLRALLDATRVRAAAQPGRLGLRLGCRVERAIDAEGLVGKQGSVSGVRVLRMKGRDGSSVEETEVVEGFDVVLVADGVHSVLIWDMLRRSGDNMPAHVMPAHARTAGATYRVILPRATLLADPRTQGLVEDEGSTTMVRWMGPRAHVVAFPMRGGMEWNVVLVHHPVEGSTFSHQRGDGRVEEEVLLKHFDNAESGWNETVRALVGMARELKGEPGQGGGAGGERRVWMLQHNYDPPPLWVHGNVAVLGDAAHPMLPHVAQGAAMAIEDAATVAFALDRLDANALSTKDVNVVLRAWEMARRRRVDLIQGKAIRAGEMLQLEDGEAQRRRDEGMRMDREKGPAKDGRMMGKRDDPQWWSEREWTEYMHGEDVMVKMAGEWDELVAAVLEGTGNWALRKP